MNYLLPIAAVFSGFLFVLIFKQKSQKNIRLLLAFSGAFLLSLTIFSLLPEIYTHSDAEQTGIFIILGIVLQLFLEFFSKGAEHGHIHPHNNKNSFPWLIFISLSIHSILEGMPVHNHHHLVYAIVLHKIPVTIMLSTFFFISSIPKRHSVIFLLLFSLMTPLGTVLTEQFIFLVRYQNQISALAVGVFLHVSTTILFESSEEHTFNLKKFIIVLTGILTAYFL